MTGSGTPLTQVAEICADAAVVHLSPPLNVDVLPSPS